MVLVAIVRLPLVPLLINSACVDSALVSRVVATLGARPRLQVRYTLAMRLPSAPYDLGVRLAKCQRGGCDRDKGSLTLGYMHI